MAKQQQGIESIAEVKTTGKVNRKNIHKVREKALYSHLEPMLEETFKALRAKIRAGDNGAIRLALQVTEMVSGGKQPGIVNYIDQRNNSNALNNATVVTQEEGGDAKMTFDSIIRRLDSRDNQITGRASAAVIEASLEE